MRMLRLVAIASTIVVSLNAQAQNLITELSGSIYREKTVYAVYDLPGTDIKVETIENAVLDAIHLYARDARVQQGIPPSPFPDYPGQMTLGRRMSGGPKPDCAGEVFSIEGIDSSMAKYGEATYHRACLYPYAGGYRINYFAIYGQKSGVGSSNPNALAAMFGRAMAGAVGLNDSSSFINKVLSRLEGNLQDNGVTFKLVQLHPKDLGGRVVMEDDLPKPATLTAAVEQAPMPIAPAPTAQIKPTADVSRQQLPQKALPPELVQLRAMLMQQREEARQEMAAQQPAAVTVDKERSAADARKELAAMGLQYFNQDQFVSAILRGDALAVDLFIAGSGVDLNAPAQGTTPLAAAESGERQEIIALLKNAGAH
jgi:hypothetical protein